MEENEPALSEMAFEIASIKKRISKLPASEMFHVGVMSIVDSILKEARDDPERQISLLSFTDDLIRRQLRFRR